MKPINLKGLEHYSVDNKGFIYSPYKKRWLKPIINSCGYIMYSLYNEHLKKRKFHMVSQLVALTYISEKPTPKHEVNHIDHNRQNNDYNNLEWCTHSENILKSFKNGRCSYWLGKTKPPLELSTKILMSNAKKKRVEAFKFGKSLGVFNSIGEMCDNLAINRKTYNRIIAGENVRLAKQYSFKVLSDIVG